MAQNGGEKRRVDRIDNLGWLAGSTIQPSKRREIEGVSATSMMDLQAQLYQQQEHSKQRRDGLVDPLDKHPGMRRGGIAAVMERKNRGVEARDQQDKLHVKPADRTSECYAALERKAQLYEKLARGDVDDDAEQYEVDFMRKGVLTDEDQQGGLGYGYGYGGDEDDGYARGRGGHEQPVDTMLLAVEGSGGLMSDDMARERERRRWEEEQQQRLREEREAQERQQHHKEEIMNLAQQTRQNRERALQDKQQKEEEEGARLQRLKDKFMKKQLQKLKAARAGGSKDATGTANKSG